MNKIKFNTVNSANISVSNSVDTEKVYDIVANITMSTSKKITGVNNGQIKKDGKTVCTFSKYDGLSLNVSFQTTDTTEMCNILHSLTLFLTNAELEIENSNLFEI